MSKPPLSTLQDVASSCKTLKAAAKLVEGHHGIESVSVGGHTLRYLNMGDTYDQTITREGNGPLVVRSWGDWVEQAEIDHEKETDTIRCGYCSHFTPRIDGVEWRDTRCENCGRNVSTGDVMPEPKKDEDE